MSVLEQAVTDVSAAVKEMLGEIEDSVVGTYTLADAIREGGSCSPGQSQDWAGEDGSVCALSAAAAAIRAHKA